MILAFKPQFKNKILDGSKIHTIREKGDRWKIKNHIHFATGVRTKNYECFHEGVCQGLQDITINWDDFDTEKEYKYNVGVWLVGPKISIDGRILSEKEVHELSINDGFNDLFEFFEFFVENFKGKLIHWTDKRY